MSGSTSRRNCSTMAIRKRTELMFQETIFTPVHLGGGGEGGKVGGDLGAVCATRIPFALSLSKGSFPRAPHWWQRALRQAQGERERGRVMGEAHDVGRAVPAGRCMRACPA